MINIYCHRNKQDTQWAGWHELKRLWPASSEPSVWSTSEFVRNIQAQPRSDYYFDFRTWHSDIGVDQKGFYLSHHGNSKAMLHQYGLSTLEPVVRDQINQGTLTLLVAYVMESFDSNQTLLEWQDQFCCYLNDIGIRRPGSVKVLLGSWHRKMQIQQDIRVQWIYYPFFESCVKARALWLGIDASVPRPIIPRPCKFLHLVRTPRLHRQIVAMLLEYLGVADRGLLTWPTSWPHTLYVDRLDPHNVYEIGMRSFPRFRQFVTANRRLCSNYINSTVGGRVHGAIADDWFSSMPYYDQCEFELVNETHHCIGDMVFLTEKTFRALCLGMPFVWIGSGPGLDILKSLSYRTFDSEWPESYSQEQSPMHALVQACQRVHDLCQKHSIGDSRTLSDIVSHNQTTFWSKDHAKLIHDALTSDRDIS